MAAVGKSGQYWSAFSPSNIPGLALWYDFSDTSTFDLSGDYVITRVRDKSGNGYHGTPTGAANPFYLIYDSIYRGAYRTPERTAVSIQTDISLDSTWRFYSFAAAVTGATQDVIRSTNRDQGWFFNYTGGKWTGGANTNAQLVVGDGTYPNAPSVGSWISGGIMRGWRNGTQYDYGTCTPPRAQSNVGAIRVGTQALFNGGLYNEILIYSNGITDADRAALDEYLIRKWMINPNYTTTITAPTDISGCVLWLDSSGDTASNFVFGPSSSNVYKWIDKSGNNYDVSTIGTNYPIWTSADTSGMYLTSTTTMSTTAPVPPTGEETGFFVGIRVGQAANRTLVTSATSRTGVIRNVFVGSGTTYGFNQSNGATGLQGTVLGSSSVSNSLITWRTKGISELFAKVNGDIGLYSTTWSNTTTATGTTTIGPAFHCCKEMITYNRTLSFEELSNVERYLIKKWGVSNAMDYPVPSLNRPFAQTPAFARRSEFPNDIAPCMLWLDAADSNTLVLDSNNNVLRWLDKSGLQNDVCASVPAASPAVAGPVYSDQTVTFSNNRMTVRNPEVTMSNFRMLPGLTVANHTLMAVHKPLVTNASDTGNTGLFDFSIQSTSTSNVSFPTMVGTTPRGWTWSGNSLTSRTGSTLVENSTTSNYNIITASIGYLRQTVYNNGVIQSDFSGATINAFVFNASNSIMSIGRWGSNTSNFYQGDVKEMFVFDRALGEYEIAYIESYLAKKWNLTSLLPSNHFAFSSNIPPIIATKFLPTTHGAVAVWLDAYSFSSNYSDGQTITTNWSNQGVSNMTFVPSGTPAYLSNAYNGRPGVRMTGGTFAADSGLALDFNNHRTFIVASYDSDSSGNRHAVSIRTTTTTSPSQRVLVVGTDGSLNSEMLNSTNGRAAITYGSVRPAAGVPFMFESITSDVNFAIAVNGALASNVVGSYVSFTGTTWQTVYLGRDYSNSTATWRGNIHEIIVYAPRLNPITEQLRHLTRSYLASKWGISNAAWTTYAPYKGIGP